MQNFVKSSQYFTDKNQLISSAEETESVREFKTKFFK